MPLPLIVPIAIGGVALARIHRRNGVELARRGAKGDGKAGRALAPMDWDGC